MPRWEGTTGKPSDQPRSYAASTGSSADASSTLRLVNDVAPKRSASSSAKSGSTDIEPQPGRISGSSVPRSSAPLSASQLVRSHPTVARHLAAVHHRHERRHGLDVVVPRHGQVVVVQHVGRLPAEPGHELGVVLGEHGEASAAANGMVDQLGEHRLDITAGRAVAFHKRHEAIDETRQLSSGGWIFSRHAETLGPRG